MNLFPTRSRPTLLANHSFEFRWKSRKYVKSEPWNSRPPDFVITDIAFGPLACSAPKLLCRTLNSCTNSVFGFTDVAQLQPGSAPGVPSRVMSRDCVRVPLAVKLPMALWLLLPPPWYSPL